MFSKGIIIRITQDCPSNSRSCCPSVQYFLRARQLDYETILRGSNWRALATFGQDRITDEKKKRLKELEVNYYLHKLYISTAYAWSMAGFLFPSIEFLYLPFGALLWSKYTLVVRCSCSTSVRMRCTLDVRACSYSWKYIFQTRGKRSSSSSSE